MSSDPSSNISFPGYGEETSVTNIVKLRRILSNTLRHGDNRIVDGGTTIGDGLGGLFVYDSTSFDADDGTVTVKPIDLGIGEPGRWKIVEAHGATSSDASSITYGGEYASVRDALDALLYVAPVISAFAASPPVTEIGSTIGSVALSWSLNKTVTSEAIAGLAALTPDARSTTAIGPFTANQSWTLMVGDGKTTVAASAALSFQQKRYWGVAPTDTLTNAQILALNGEFSTTKAKAITYNCSGGNYPYFAYPAPLGDTVGVTVGGFAFSDLVIATQNVTNASGYTAPYKVVRFGYIQNGAAISVVWS